MPGAVRASAGINTRGEDIDRLLAGVASIAAGEPAPVAYVQDASTGDFMPAGAAAPDAGRRRAACNPG